MNKPVDLKERIFQFTMEVRFFIKALDNSIANVEDGKHLFVH